MIVMEEVAGVAEDAHISLSLALTSLLGPTKPNACWNLHQDGP